MNENIEPKTFTIPPVLLTLLLAYGPQLVVLAKQAADAAIDKLAAELGIKTS